MKMIKEIIILALVVSAFASCSTESNNESVNENQIESAIAAPGQSEEEIKAALKEIEEEEKALASSTTTLKFDKTVHNFGKIKEDTENPVTFVVTNTGKNPLIIDKVEVSCGCTTAEKPEKPILPGKSENISVVFHPKVGQLNDQKKSITVTSNAESKVDILSIEAFVIK